MNAVRADGSSTERDGHVAVLPCHTIPILDMQHLLFIGNHERTFSHWPLRRYFLTALGYLL